MNQSDEIDELRERVTAMDAAFTELLKWRTLGRAAVAALSDQDGITRGYIQACDQAIEDIKRSASGCGVDLD